jgi:hypothetical protein
VANRSRRTSLVYNLHTPLDTQSIIYHHFTSSPAAAFLALSASQAVSWPISCRTRMLLCTPYSHQFPLYSTEETIKGFALLKICHPNRFHKITCHSTVLQPCPRHQDVSRPYRAPSTLHTLPNNPPGRLLGSQGPPNWIMSHISQQPRDTIWAHQSSTGQCYRVLKTL